MAKTYKILVNDGKGTEIKPVSVVQGAGAKGDPVRMVAKRGWRFELQDDIKGKGLAPDQVRLKRMGKNLAVMFDGSQNADVVIEDFYADNKDDDKDNGMPMLIGQAENGGLYEYVPQDPAASSMPSQLKDGNTPVIASLGGGPLPTDFVLAGLPLVAAGGGLGGWLAGGAAAAAAAAGGGGGGGGAVAVVAALKVRIINDINNDGYINKDELGTATKVSVEVDVPAGAVAGNTINVVSGGSTIPHVLTQAEVDAKKFTLLNAFDKPAEGATITVTASFNNVSASDVAKLDTSAFVNPVDPLNPTDPTKSGLRVKIDTDANDDGKINNAENAATITATVSLTTDAAAGDVVTVKATNNVDRTITLTQADITAKKLVLTDLIKPAEGAAITVTASIKDVAGNTSPTPEASDTATMNTTSPLVRIINDINNDGYINKDELGTATKVSVEVDVPAGAVAGNTINVVSGGSTIPHVLTQAEVDAKKFTLLNAFDKPAEGATITVTASFNNVSASDVAKLDTSAFVDPLDSSKSGLGVSIDSDDNNNGTITKAEFVAPTNASKIRATISLSGDVAVGDVVTVTATGNTDRTFTLTQAQVTAKKIIITDLTPPAEGGSIVVTASIKDEAGNKSPTPNAQDAAVLDTGVPNGGIAPIVEIVTDSGPIPGGDKWVNGPELNGATSFSIKATFDPLKVAIGEKVVFRAVTTISGVPTVESKEVEITQTDLTNGFATVNFALPAKGKNLSVTALIKDSGGNVTDTSLADDASLNDLTAVADANNVTAVANGNTVKIEGNVIAGTSSGAGKDIEYQYSGNDVFITSVKKGTDSSTSFNPLTGANGGTVEAEYGTLTIRADGSYDYVLNSSDKTKALIEGQKVIETFSYKVKDTGGNESDTTLSIEVTGVNDSANVSFKAGSTYSIASNLIRIDTGTDDIVITDVDAGQAKFDGIATIGANFDLRFGLLTLNPAGSASTSTSKGYAVSYVLNNDGNVDVTDVLRHDLFALKSSDGTWKDTLDFVIGSTGAATKQEFHTSTVENLQITAASTSMTDKVVLHGSQLAFDFTAPTSSTDSIEKIDITGTGNNTVKLNLASLTQADAVGGVHKLFVDGNAGDVVNFVHTSIAADTTVAGYNRYVIDSTHELLVQQALSTNFVS